MKKNILLVLALVLSIIFLASCSDEKSVESDGGISKEEILSQYESIAQQSYENLPIGSGASVLGENFSQIDFTFSSVDNTIAYSLDMNSFAKITAGGTYFASLAPGSEVETFDAGFKTARGLSLGNSASEYMNLYGLDASNSLYIIPGDTVYYQVSSQTFNGKLTAVFASADSMGYAPLGYGDVQKFLYQRAAFSQGVFVNSEKIMEIFPSYSSLVSIDITASESGAVSEVVFSRFDK